MNIFEVKKLPVSPSRFTAAKNFPSAIKLDARLPDFLFYNLSRCKDQMNSTLKGDHDGIIQFYSNKKK